MIDEVKVYCHEGEGEKTEHLYSMDLTDIKSELVKDAEEAEVSPPNVQQNCTLLYSGKKIKMHDSY